MVQSRLLSLFIPGGKTILKADASSYGLGAVLMQRLASDTLRPLAYISRSMSATEHRYALIEKALAIT